MSAFVTDLSAEAPLSVAPVEDRPAGMGLTARVLIAWLVLCAILLAAHGQNISTRHFPDPDDIMRLIEVRDLLNGQHWFDLHQYRVMPPAGVPMHWSRLVDIPLAGMILVLRPILGQSTAELVTCVVVPLLTLLAAMLLVARLAAREFELETAAIASLLTGLAAPAVYQMQPMRIDHHGWQLVLSLAALNGLFARDPRKGGLIIGVSLACSLSISLENLPLAALFIAVAWLRLLRQADGATWLLWTINSFAAASIFFFLATRGLSDLAQHCDAVSPWHLSVFALGAAGCSALPALRGRGIAAVLGASVLIGAGAIALMLIQAPECRNGAFAALDPLVRKYWYNAVLEGQPVWRLPVGTIVTLIALGPVGLFATLRLRARSTSLDEHRRWTDMALLLAGAIVVGVLVSRASATSCLLAVVPAAWLIHQRILKARTYTSRPLRQIGSYLLTALIALPGVPLLALASVMPSEAAALIKTEKPAETCNTTLLGQHLSRMAPTDIFMPLDIAPEVIVNSPDRVVATGHHRGNAGMRDVIGAFTSPAPQAEAIVRGRHATLLLYCPGLPEISNYTIGAPGGLAAQLEANRPPAWLEPVDLAPGSGFRVYRVLGGS